MKQLPIRLSLTALCLVFCSGSWAQQTLQPTDNCRDHAASAIVTFADAVLEMEVREAMSLGPLETLSCDRAAQLTTLRASGGGARRSVSGSPEWVDPEHLFHDLSGIQNLIGLTNLALSNRGL
ncbi:MAG TPA: hypothetical protein EYG31_12100, partial [Porticoccaceae bacterium]|nr:hypothetical protein [Porticoccaceae bacterium]